MRSINLEEVIRTEADARGINLENHLQETLKLEQDAPYGRCSDCNLALSESDTTAWPYNMHINCANDHYGDE